MPLIEATPAVRVIVYASSPRASRRTQPGMVRTRTAGSLSAFQTSSGVACSVAPPETNIARPPLATDQSGSCLGPTLVLRNGAVEVPADRARRDPARSRQARPPEVPARPTEVPEGWWGYPGNG